MAKKIQPAGINPKDKIGITKVPLDVVPVAGIIHEAIAMQDGVRKYNKFNWRDQPVNLSVYYAACMRHLLAWYDGEDIAEDSKAHHLGHAKSCLGIMLDAIETGNANDDRPNAGAAARLIEEYKERTNADASPKRARRGSRSSVGTK